MRLATIAAIGCFLWAGVCCLIIAWSAAMNKINAAFYRRLEQKRLKEFEDMRRLGLL
jgi:hypothetical protein